jgi:outer membrane protein assembly factor BamB
MKKLTRLHYSGSPSCASWRKKLIALSCMYIVGFAATSAQAQTPPTIAKIYTAPGQISGGLASDGTGNLYFATLENPSTGARSKVISINSAGTQRWQWDSPVAGANMRMVPTLSPDGTRLFVPSDQGKVFALNTANGSLVWQYPPSGNLTAPVRAEIAYDPQAPQSIGGTVPTIYFHANDGYLYSINATTGAYRWRAYTANQGGPPPAPGEHDIPWSSAAVVGRDSTIYVGSANGYLYCFNPATSVRQWRVKLNASGLTSTPDTGEPIEATPAIGENGWIYVGTRHADNLPNGTAISHLYAIDPARTEKIVWTLDLDVATGSPDTPPGIIAGLALDWCGRVYVTRFHGSLVRVDGTTGAAPLGSATLFAGKYCQAPALARDGTLYVGTSDPSDIPFVDPTVRAFDTTADVFNELWEQTEWTQTSPPSSGPFGRNFFGGVLIRANTSGTIYIADADPVSGTGAVYSFASTPASAAMAGDWATLGGGNLRPHKARTYYTTWALNAFPNGDPAGQSACSVDSQARIIGTGLGEPGCSKPGEWYGAWWPGGGSPIVLGEPCYVSIRDFAYRANSAGHVVGLNYTGPIVWKDGLAGGNSSLLPLPQGFNYGEARDINSESGIVGFSYDSSGQNGGGHQVLRWDFNGSSWKSFSCWQAVGWGLRVRLCADRQRTDLWEGCIPRQWQRAGIYE